jgi:hypothetical protein
MLLRAEFEPLLLSGYGLHRDPVQCKAVWDREPCSDARLAAQVARATEWLSHWPRTKVINKKAGTSCGLKHVAEHWHRARSPGRDYYISNGALLMAAHRLGFMIEPTTGWSGDWYDFANAWLNIASAAGDYAQ